MCIDCYGDICIKCEDEYLVDYNCELKQITLC